MSVIVSSQIPGWTDLAIPVTPGSTILSVKQAVATRLKIDISVFDLYVNGLSATILDGSKLYFAYKLF